MRSFEQRLLLLPLDGFAGNGLFGGDPLFDDAAGRVDCLGGGRSDEQAQACEGVDEDVFVNGHSGQCKLRRDLID